MKCSECKEKIQCDLCEKTIYCKGKCVIVNKFTKVELNICEECAEYLKEKQTN